MDVSHADTITRYSTSQGCGYTKAASSSFLDSAARRKHLRSLRSLQSLLVRHQLHPPKYRNASRSGELSARRARKTPKSHQPDTANWTSTTHLLQMKTMILQARCETAGTMIVMILNSSLATTRAAPYVEDKTILRFENSFLTSSRDSACHPSGARR